MEDGWRVPVLHVGGFFVVECFENVGAGFFGETGEEVDFGAHDHEVRRDVEFRGGLPQFWEEHERQQEGADDIGGNGAFVVLGDAVRARRDSGILHDCIQSVQAFRPLHELLHGFVARQVQLPHFDHTSPLGALLNGLLGRLALFEASHREDDFGGGETGEVTGGLEAETNIGTGHNDGLAGEGGLGIGEASQKLVVEEFEEEAHVGGSVWYCFTALCQ